MKILKRAFLFLLALLVLLASVTGIAAIYYGDEIKNLVVQNLNKNINTEIKVTSVDFSVFQDFPKASVVFSDVVIYAVNAKNDTLLSAKKLSAQFNLIDLYKNDYKLIGLSARTGKCNMVVDNSGKANYIFWNQSDTASNPVSIELNNVEFQEMEYTYLDYSKNIGVHFLIDQANLAGNFKEQVFGVELNTTLKKANIQIGETNLFEDRTLFIDLTGNIDQNEEQLNFTTTNLGVDAMNIGISGSVNYGERSRLDLNLKSENADLQKAIALLPANIRKKLNRFNIDGSARLAGSVNGQISAITAPFYDFNFAVSNGIFKDKKSDIQFSETNLLGSISNGSERNLRTTKLDLESFETSTKEGKIDGKLLIENFKKPKYNYVGNVTLDLEETAELLKSEELKEVEGKVQARLNVSGRLIEVGTYTLNDWKASKIGGSLTLQDVGFEFNSTPQKVSDIEGELSFTNNSLSVKNLKGNIDQTDIELSGKFNNLIAFLLDEKEALFVDAKVNSNYINLGELLASNPTAQKKDDNYGLDISPRVTIYVALTAKELEFNKFNLKDLSGNLIVKNEQVDARGISFKSQEGKVSGDLFLREKNDKLILVTQSQFDEVDIKKLFESFNNFGQTSLLSKHLEGTANVNVNFTSWWSKDFKINPKSIRADISFTINDGELNNYKPLETLSKFIELEELKEIKFKQLHNQILVKDEEIIIPRFEILSSAMNLSIAGTHNFNNDIDYHITLLLNEVLGRKAKKPKVTEFGYVESDGLQGQSKLYLKMTGNIDDIKVAYDSKGLKDNVKSKLSKEKNTVKSLLKDEFGVFKNDTTVKSLPSEIESENPFEVEVDSSYIKKYTNKEGPQNKTDKKKAENEPAKKSKFGKFLDKIAKPNEEEFVAPIEN